MPKADRAKGSQQRFPRKKAVDVFDWIRSSHQLTYTVKASRCLRHLAR